MEIIKVEPGAESASKKSGSELVDKITDVVQVVKNKFQKNEVALLTDQEAHTYLDDVKKSSRMIGFGVTTILAGVSALLLLGNPGLFVLFLGIAIAVPLFIMGSQKVEKYEKLEGLPVFLDAPTYELIEKQHSRYAHQFPFRIGFGVGLILLAVGALTAFGLNPGVLTMAVGVSVFLFVTAGMTSGAYDILLGRGDYEYIEARKRAEHVVQTALAGRELPQVEQVDKLALDQGSELDAVLSEGKRFVTNLESAACEITNSSVSADIDAIITLTNKIIYRLQKEPNLISSTGRFFDYYLPITAKLVASYGEWEKQGTLGENITSTMGKIENTLSKLVVAYQSQLDRLYFETSIDLETDISALEVMLKNEGLT